MKIKGLVDAALQTAEECLPEAPLLRERLVALGKIVNARSVVGGNLGLILCALNKPLFCSHPCGKMWNVFLHLVSVTRGHGLCMCVNDCVTWHSPTLGLTFDLEAQM